MLQQRTKSLLLSVFLVPYVLAAGLFGQSPEGDPFLQQLPAFALQHETIFDGLSKLSQMTNVAFAAELPLGQTIADPAPSLKTLSGTVGPGTLKDELDRLCGLDPDFSWLRIDNTVHIIPRPLEHNQRYLLNRKIEVLELRNVPDAQVAVFETVAQLKGKKEQIAVLQTGIPVTFSHAWSATFRDITVREAFDKIAQQLGNTYGWQFAGADDFRVLTFHQRLSARASKNERPLTK